jgi:hypothetical protein
MYLNASQLALITEFEHRCKILQKQYQNLPSISMQNEVHMSWMRMHMGKYYCLGCWDIWLQINLIATIDDRTEQLFFA